MADAPPEPMKQDPTGETAAETALRQKGEAQAQQEAAARGKALTTDRVVDQPTSG